MPINSTDLENLKELMAVENGMADEVSRFWSRWKEARSTVEERANETKQFLYATSTHETTNSGKGGVDGEGFDHSTHIPKLSQIADNLAAHYKRSLFGNRKWLDFISHDQNAANAKKRQAVLSYLRTKHDLNDFEEVMGQLIDDWIIYGNCFAELEYVDESHIDESTGEKIQGFQGTRICRINPFDIVFNLQASSFKESPKIIRRVHSMGHIARMVEENKTNGWSEKAFKKGMDLRNQLSRFDYDDLRKELQPNLDGLGSFFDYYREGYVEILEFYGDFYDTEREMLLKNQVITVMDRRYVLRQEEVKTWSGKPHIYNCEWRSRPDSLWGMSPLENLLGMQYMINHLRNGISDATDHILYPQKFIQGDITEPENTLAPDATWYDPEGDGAVTFLRPDTTFLTADFQIDKLEAQMEAYAGSPRETMGIRTAGEKTAFEVQTLRESAMGIFQHRIIKFEDTFVKQIINGEIELGRQFINSDTVKIIDDDTGVEEFIKITRKDLEVNGTIVPVGAKHFVERAQQVQEYQGLMQTLAADPEVRMHFSSFEMAKDLSTALKIDNKNVVSKNIRVAEQLEVAQLQNQASRQLQAEEQGALEADERNLAAFSEEGGGF